MAARIVVVGVVARLLLAPLLATVPRVDVLLHLEIVLIVIVRHLGWPWLAWLLGCYDGWMVSFVNFRTLVIASVCSLVPSEASFFRMCALCVPMFTAR
uniref:Uncharacterized protein n=1 Tax=Anopheles braziliensis TaxID=58242 RepID=A0A2M3ZL20_9DIPT